MDHFGWCFFSRCFFHIFLSFSLSSFWYEFIRQSIMRFVNDWLPSHRIMCLLGCIFVPSHLKGLYYSIPRQCWQKGAVIRFHVYRPNFVYTDKCQIPMLLKCYKNVQSWNSNVTTMHPDTYIHVDRHWWSVSSVCMHATHIRYGIRIVKDDNIIFCFKAPLYILIRLHQFSLSIFFCLFVVALIRMRSFCFKLSRSSCYAASGVASFHSQIPRLIQQIHLSRFQIT